MKRSKSVRDFDFYIDEYMYNCQSRKLRKKTLQAYEQALRLFERWYMDEMGITSPEVVREATFRRYICDMQERGKYTFYSVEESAIGYLQVSSTRYIKEYRREKACQMLTQTRKSVAEISAECGMNNSYFGKKFREETGLTPLGYRRVYYRNKADKE